MIAAVPSRVPALVGGDDVCRMMVSAPRGRRERGLPPIPPHLLNVSVYFRALAG
jgi:hypothetical protein